jgi:hypothetical protein
MPEFGIITLAFGESYDEMAARCFRYSRKNTDLPILVLSNLKNRSKIWNEINNVSFINFDVPQNVNREYKTSMYKYSTFDKTLYVDSDAIIQHKGVEEYLKRIPEDGVLVNVEERFDRRNQVYNLYRDAYVKAGVDVPLAVYYGGCVGFGKGNNIIKFFKDWNKSWIDNGKGREMPCLSCAVKLYKGKVIEIDNNSLFSWKPVPHTIIQHEYQGLVSNKVGYSQFKTYKPFDAGKHNMWAKDWR